MLVTAGRADKGVETELYDSGASRHMTAYRNRLVKPLNKFPLNKFPKIRTLRKTITLVPILIVQTSRNQLRVVNEFVSHPPMLNNSKVALLLQMDDATNHSFLRVFKRLMNGKRILGLLEWTRI